MQGLRGKQGKGQAMLHLVRNGLLSCLLAVALLLPSGAAPLSMMTAAQAVEPDEVLDDPALEARARELSKNLRCLVCQNESIDESNAPLARDLRILLRERLKAGDTDEQAIQFLVDRYGEYVLLKPRFSGHTLLLWLGPFAVLIIGLLGAFIYLRRRVGTAATSASAEAPLSDDERQRLQELLDGK